MLMIFLWMVVSVAPCVAQQSNDTLLLIVKTGRGKSDTGRFKVYRPGMKVVCTDTAGNKTEGKLQYVGKNYLMVDSVKIGWEQLKKISRFTRSKKIIFYTGVGVAAAALAVVFMPSSFIPLKIIMCAPFSTGTALALASKPGSEKPGSEPLLIPSNAYQMHSIPGDPVSIGMPLPDFERYREIKAAKKEKKFPRRMREYDYPHSLTATLTDLLINQISFTYSYRFSKVFSVSITPGYMFSTLEKTGKLVPVISNISKKPGPNYNPWVNSGFHATLTTKLFMPSKPNRYFGLCAFGKWLHYDKEKTGIKIYYHDSAPLYALQSDRFSMLGGALFYGWQITTRNKLTFDFYLGGGAYNRSGKVTQWNSQYDILNHNSYSHTVYPAYYRYSYWYPTLYGGIQMGLRFGKRKTASGA